MNVAVRPSSSLWSTTVPDFQVVYDSTSLGWLKECPTLYYYQMIEGWTRRAFGGDYAARSVHLIFGQLYASGVEHFAKVVAGGLDHEAAVRSMIRHVLKLAWNHGGVDENGEHRPWDPPKDHPDASIKNRYTLIRSLVWNADDRRESVFRTVIKRNGKPAVEESFNFYAFHLGDDPIHLAGHMDEIVEHTSTLDKYVSDDKTTKSALTATYFKRYTPDNQMSLYTLAGKVILDEPVAGVLVKAAQIQVEGTRFAMRPINRTPQVLEEWMDDTHYWIGQAQSFARTQRWPKNDKHCSNFGGCAFQEVCARSPNHRAAWLREDFVRFEWNPTVSRGE